MKENKWKDLLIALLALKHNPTLRSCAQYYHNIIQYIIYSIKDATNKEILITIYDISSCRHVKLCQIDIKYAGTNIHDLVIYDIINDRHGDGFKYHLTAPYGLITDDRNVLDKIHPGLIEFLNHTIKLGCEFEK